VALEDDEGSDRVDNDDERSTVSIELGAVTRSDPTERAVVSLFMLCRYFALQLILGAAVALAELVWPLPTGRQVTRDKPRDIPETDVDSDTYLREGDISGDILEWLQRLPVLEPDDTPLVADRFIRSAP